MKLLAGDGTHYKKRKAQRTRTSQRGKAPIEKNVRVTDEWGNEYEATYPKRAKGLVKKGRARFLSDDRICLACPPNRFDLEDMEMSEFENTNLPETNEIPETPEVPEVPEVPEAPETPEAPEAPEAPEVPETFSLDYVLKQIAAIQADTVHINDAMKRIYQLEPGDETRACAIRDIVTVRETTNQRLLAFYERMYNDVKRASPAPRWGTHTYEEVSRAASKARDFGGRVGGKMKGFFKDMSSKAPKDVFTSKEPTLREKVLDVLQDPELGDEDREVIFDSLDLLKTLAPDMQDEALGVLANVELSAEEKTHILENLEEIAKL